MHSGITSDAFDLLGKWSEAVCFNVPASPLCIIMFYERLYGRRLAVIQVKAAWDSGRNLVVPLFTNIVFFSAKAAEVNDRVTQRDSAGGQQSNWAVRRHQSRSRS